METFKYRFSVRAKLSVTRLPLAASKVCLPLPTSVEYVRPSAEPAIDRVCARLFQSGRGGSLSTTRPSVVALPRSMVTVAGKAFSGPSQ
jgi:hypothetical protein